jgi:hypothetical protein
LSRIGSSLDLAFFKYALTLSQYLSMVIHI